MDPRTRVAGESADYNSTGEKNPAGVYRHRETGAEIIALETPKFGSVQADAMRRVGFEYVRPAERAEIVNKNVNPHAAPVATPLGVETVAELESKLAAAKAREAEFDDVRKQQEEEAQEAKKVEDARVAAETEARQKAFAEQEAVRAGETATEKAKTEVAQEAGKKADKKESK